MTPIGNQRGPIGACLADRRSIGRFAIRWAALMGLMIAALPTAFLAGLGLLHILIRASA